MTWGGKRVLVRRGRTDRAVEPREPEEARLAQAFGVQHGARHRRVLGVIASRAVGRARESVVGSRRAERAVDGAALGERARGADGAVAAGRADIPLRIARAVGKLATGRRRVGVGIWASLAPIEAQPVLVRALRARHALV
eukprot:CAMPEP_0181339606 /NCGR_PEP_ID=MMETSP1101-20121128/29360_1 /TAXON_ID=46948 /ORGANISM="Rhodomonas abbreviata, Strain Caron Lab Isolate" /LENGTH=139 /DNA_ID=CAMNT_0023450615 /DNA_START=136 /DNA_END=553 /DNA_ORIENTATION=+